MDSCVLDKEEGKCNLNVQKYYFDLQSGSCQPFTYGGCGGNSNNFDSLKECQNHCSIDSCSLPHDKGPCRESKRNEWFFDRQTQRCKLFEFGGCDGNKNRFGTELNCQKACGCRDEHCIESSVQQNRGSIDTCLLPKKKGRCNLNIQKYYFDSELGTCKPFLYGGCQGNSNNFDTLAECLSRCSFDTCDLPKDEGPCNITTTKWYYNQIRGQCEFFSYGGCVGNQNNFNSKSQCEGHCLKDKCSLPKAKGPCGKDIIRWYYDSKSGHCESFLYSGCRGNRNNFASRSECEDGCKSQSDKHFWTSLPDGRWLTYEETKSLKDLYPTFIPLAYHDPVRKIVKEAGLAKLAKDSQ